MCSAIKALLALWFDLRFRLPARIQNLSSFKQSYMDTPGKVQLQKLLHLVLDIQALEWRDREGTRTGEKNIIL